MTRRGLVGAMAGGAALSAAGPARAQIPREVDVAVIGGGAAGIAAARHLLRAEVTTVLIEARRRIGGRCFTDRQTFSAPFDRGAHWLHVAESNPIARLGRALNVEIYPDPANDRLQLGDKAAEEGETAAYLQAVAAAEAALIRFAETRSDDAPASQGLPRDLGEWRGPVGFRLGPWDCGKQLAEISVVDYARSALGEDHLVRGGLGHLVATLGRGLPTSLATPVTRIEVEGGRVRVETNAGTLTARAAIVTASTAVLASGAIRFTPELPEQVRAALDGLRLGSYLHVGVEIPGNPFGVDDDQTIFSKIDEERTFAVVARVGGSDVWSFDTGGIYARELELAGEATAVALATDWLASAFGARARGLVTKGSLTQWGLDPLVRGAWSVASPGRAGARAILRQPIAERLFLAGEACHDTQWGTVAGAWETGEAAAREAVKLVRG
jgi:monoamine oxidase